MIRPSDFDAGFAWGVSSSAYQTEGAWDSEGKGPSVWDVFTSRQQKVRGGHTGRVACDFYNRYIKDIILMEFLQVRNFRTSLSWSRILPEGSGKPNLKGLDFYDRMIDFCLECGIRPWLTLYHWDLPQALDERGGWNNRDILGWFSDYAALCVRRYGDRVRHWMVLNEPIVFTGAGHFLGLHAPGRKGLGGFLSAVHHAALCQAEGARVIRTLQANSYVGTTQSFTHIDPLEPGRMHQEAARRVDAVANRLFLEPLLGMGYPWNDFPALEGLQAWMKAGDESLLACPLDFIGVQQYTREVVRHSPLIPYLQARMVNAKARRGPVTDMGWEVYPEGIYQILKKLAAYANIPDLIITENGAAYADPVTEGKVHDPERIAYFESYIGQVARARREGLPVKGYFAWSLTDNFEWAEGYDRRFGLIHVDFRTQQRTIKSSGYWYRSLLQQLQAGNADGLRGKEGEDPAFPHSRVA